MHHFIKYKCWKTSNRWLD